MKDNPYYLAGISVTKRIGLLILCIIIAGVITYALETVYGLDELVDTYENETNIRAKYHTVRNVTYDRMELTYDAVGDPTYEDFTSFTEQDSATRLQQTANRSDFNMIRTDNNIYLYKDYGVANFDNFTHEFTIFIDSCDSSASAQYRNVLIGYTNMLGDWLAYWTNTQSLDLIAKSNNVVGQFSLRLVSGYNGGSNMWFWNESSALADDTYYFLRLIKSEKNCSLEVYSDNDRTILVTRIECDQLFSQTYRYIECPASLDYASGSWWIDGFVEQLWLGETVGGYDHEGTFHTKKLNTTANHLVLLYNITLGSGDTMKVQFSPDNSTWYTHNKVLGNDTLVSGYESLDLRDLNYSSVFMKFYFLNGGADSTPYLYDIRLVNTEIVTGNATTTNVYVMQSPNNYKYAFYGLAFVLVIMFIYLMYILVFGER